MRRKSTFPTNAFWVAMPGHRLLFVDGGGNRYQEASKAFYRAVEVLFPALNKKGYTTRAELKVKDKLPDIGEFYPHGYDAAVRITGTVQRQAMNNLFIEVQKALEAAHLAGIERGKNLLVRLAKNEVTVKQFNDNALEADR